MAGTNPFLGRWRITEMSEWDREFIDLYVPGFLEFNLDGLGSFQFGTVAGFLDYRLVEREGEPAVEWSWEGTSELDPVCGRGWAKRTGRDLLGHIFIHQSDDSELRAVRARGRRVRS